MTFVRQARELHSLLVAGDLASNIGSYLTPSLTSFVLARLDLAAVRKRAGGAMLALIAFVVAWPALEDIEKPAPLYRIMVPN